MPPDSNHLDFTEGKSTPRGSESAPNTRPYLQVYFRCANAYTRVYRNAKGDEYIARCPRCGNSMSFAVGPGGTTRRFFEVGC
jgi:hypothetical protein